MLTRANSIIRLIIQKRCNVKYLESIRLSELESVLTEIKIEKPGRNIILEIGAGAGHQAKKLSENGYKVEAIDIDDGVYSIYRVWPVLNYDGEHIPFPDKHFDIVFSSNVLEHIPHFRKFQDEVKRVLKSNGIAIHVVPSGTWRFWSNVAHYAFIFKILINIVYNRPIAKTENQICNGVENKISRLSKPGLIIKAMFPSRHGEIGNAVSEIYYFSRRRWNAIFRKNGWKIKKISPNRLFYTSHMILGSAISIQFRKYMSYLFGSSCHIFVIAKGG